MTSKIKEEVYVHIYIYIYIGQRLLVLAEVLGWVGSGRPVTAE